MTDLPETVGSLEEAVFVVAAAELRRAEAEVARLKRLLALVYGKWENGVPCCEWTDAGPNDGLPLGNAFTLTLQEQDEIVAALRQGGAA